jgi:hypothetical protein
VVCVVGPHRNILGLSVWLGAAPIQGGLVQNGQLIYVLVAHTKIWLSIR